MIGSNVFRTLNNNDLFISLNLWMDHIYPDFENNREEKERQMLRDFWIDSVIFRVLTVVETVDYGHPAPCLYDYAIVKR